MWHSEQQFNERQNQWQKAPWLKQSRQAAWDQFKLLGLPTHRDEAWKYTNIRALQKREFISAHSTSSLKLASVEPLFIPDCYTLVVENGRFHRELSTIPENIIVTPISQLFEDHPDTIKPHLNQLAKTLTHGFAHLNMALFNSGFFIKIPPNIALEKPLHCLFLTTHSDTASHQRHLIIAEENSKACVIEDYYSLNSQNYFTNTISELFISPASQIEHIKIQREDINAFHIGTTLASLQRDSQFTSHVLTTGSLLSRADTQVNLTEKGASCSLNGLYWIAGKQHCDHHTRIEHQQSDCNSHEFYKGLINDSARAVFNGQVYVNTGAIKSHAELSNKNLLLSPHAEIDTKPQLEIYNDDVKCSHGTTVGQLNDNELFYLLSRGIDETSAKNMLTSAFANEVIEKITPKNVRNKMRELFLKDLVS